MCQETLRFVWKQNSEKKKVGLKDVLRVIHEKSGVNAVESLGPSSDQLTREQKILVACLLLLLKNKKEKKFTYMQLFEVFRKVLRETKFDEVAESSCIDMVARLEDNGVVGVDKDKDTPLRNKVFLRYDETEARTKLLEHNALFEGIIDGVK